MTALFEIIPMPSSAVILETLAARRSILFLLEILDLHSSIFEGDFGIFINDIRSGKLSHSSCSHINIIKDILSSISSLLEIFSRTFKQGNILAHALAKGTKLSFPILVGWNLFLLIFIKLLYLII